MSQGPIKTYTSNMAHRKCVSKYNPSWNLFVQSVHANITTQSNHVAKTCKDHTHTNSQSLLYIITFLRHLSHQLDCDPVSFSMPAVARSASGSQVSLDDKRNVRPSPVRIRLDYITIFLNMFDVKKTRYPHHMTMAKDDLNRCQSSFCFNV